MQYYACVTAPGPQFFETRFHALGNIRNICREMVKWPNFQNGFANLGSQGSKRKFLQFCKCSLVFNIFMGKKNEKIEFVHIVVSTL